MYSSYTTAANNVEQHTPNAARERIMLGAAIADLREALYHQQCLLLALIQLLEDRGVLDAAEVLDQGRSLSSEELPDLPFTVR